jgi:chromosomal replication initiator protein
MWADTLDVVRLELNTPTFKTWFENTSPLGIIDDVLVVSVQNEFARDWLESRYSGLLASALAQVLGRPMSVSFRVGVDGTVVIETPVTSEPQGMPNLEARARSERG